MTCIVNKALLLGYGQVVLNRDNIVVIKTNILLQMYNLVQQVLQWSKHGNRKLGKGFLEFITSGELPQFTYKFNLSFYWMTQRKVRQIRQPTCINKCKLLFGWTDVAQIQVSWGFLEPVEQQNTEWFMLGVIGNNSSKLQPIPYPPCHWLSMSFNNVQCSDC